MGINSVSFTNEGFPRTYTADEQKWIPTLFLLCGYLSKISKPYWVSIGTLQTKTMKKFRATHITMRNSNSSQIESFNTVTLSKSYDGCMLQISPSIPNCLFTTIQARVEHDYKNGNYDLTIDDMRAKLLKVGNSYELTIYTDACEHSSIVIKFEDFD